ncbi:hypothetical protein TURU_144263 [Turdus rufiventris]|nr:hypothetical protein TURU_144263 [Turdus rufiventris]
MRYPVQATEARESVEWKKHIIGPLFVNTLLLFHRGIPALVLALEGRRYLARCAFPWLQSGEEYQHTESAEDVKKEWLVYLSGTGGIPISPLTQHVNITRCCGSLGTKVQPTHSKAGKQEYSSGRTKAILEDFPAQLNPGQTGKPMRKPGDSQQNPEASGDLSTGNRNGKVSFEADRTGEASREDILYEHRPGNRDMQEWSDLSRVTEEVCEEAKMRARPYPNHCYAQLKHSPAAYTDL